MVIASSLALGSADALLEGPALGAAAVTSLGGWLCRCRVAPGAPFVVADVLSELAMFLATARRLAFPSVLIGETRGIFETR